MTGTLLFTLRLRHLSVDGKKAGADLREAHLPHISVKELSALLTSLEALAPTVAYPAEPEVRISGATGEFVVQVKGGQLKLVSWSSAHKSGVATAQQIIAAVTDGGEAEEAAAPSRGKRASSRTAGSSKRGSIKDKLVMVALGAAIVAVNSFTVWFVTRPARTLTPEYTLISPERADRVLEQVAGVYETGKGPGDRRLEITRDASALRFKLGPDGTPKDKQEFTVKVAQSGGKTALLTSRNALIVIEDPISVALYGDRYTRVKN